jgi:hypothetical protein
MSRTIVNANGIVFDAGVDQHKRLVEIRRADDGSVVFLSDAGLCTLSGVGPPSSSTHATNMQYVDGAILQVDGRITAVDSKVTGIESLALMTTDTLTHRIDGNDALMDVVFSDLKNFYNGTGTADIDSLKCNDVICSRDITVGGHITAGSMTSTSDRRLKRNILTLSRDRAIHILRQLRPVSYVWASTGAQDIGFIAQEVQDVVPEFVHTSDDGVLSMDYGKITALLVSTWQSADSATRGISMMGGA